MFFLLDTLSMIVYIVMLIILTTISMLGLWSKRYRDNLLQHIGMAFVVTFSVLDVWHVCTYETISRSIMGVVAGSMFYAAGTFVKHFKRAPPAPPGPPKPNTIRKSMTSLSQNYRAK